MNKPKPIAWFTRGGKHIPIFDEDEKAKWDQIQKNKAIADKLNHPEDIKNDLFKKPEKQDHKNYNSFKKKKSLDDLLTEGDPDPAKRMVNLLAKKGISSEADIANYLRNLSPQRRNRLAVEMGIKGRGDDKTKEMANKIFLAGKREDSNHLINPVIINDQEMMNKYGFVVNYKNPAVTFSDEHWKKMRELKDMQSDTDFFTVEAFRDRKLLEQIDDVIYDVDYEKHPDLAKVWMAINDGEVTTDEMWAGYHWMAEKLGIKAPRYALGEDDNSSMWYYEEDGLFGTKEAAYEMARIKGYKRIFDRYTGKYEDVPAIKEVKKNIPKVKFEKTNSVNNGGPTTDYYKDNTTGWEIHVDRVPNPSNGTAYNNKENVTITVFDKNGKQLKRYNNVTSKALNDKYISDYAMKEIQKSAENYMNQYEDILGKANPVTDLQARMKYLKDNNIINPNYHYGQTGDEYVKWHKNCAICSAAVVMQGRGHDVEAGPRNPNRWRGCETILDYDYSKPENYVLGGARSEVDNFALTFNIVNNIEQEAVKKYPFNWSDSWELRQEGKRMREQYVKDQLAKYTRMPQGANQAAQTIQNKMKEWGENSIAELSVDWKNNTRAHSVLVFYDPNRGAYIWDSQTNTIRWDLADYLRRTTASHTQLVRVDNVKLKPFIEDDLKAMFKKRGGN